MEIQVAIPLTSSREDDKRKSYTTFLVEVQIGDQKWTVEQRYTRFLQLHHGLTDKYRKKVLPKFPSRLFYHTASDVEHRRQKFETYLKELLQDKELRDSWEVQYFLQIKQHMGVSSTLKVLVPLPDIDFDPTEASVPWKILTSEGIRIIFATETGKKPSGDPLLLEPNGVPFGLGAEFEAKQYYNEMAQDESFNNPITWDSIDVTQFDGLLLSGGHAPGVKQYLGSELLQSKVSEFWKLKRPVGAICHGVVLLCRCRDDAGFSVLKNKKTTTLTKPQESTGYYLTKWKLGKTYRTYEENLEDPEKQFQRGPFSVARGNAFDDQAAFVCEDGNYISARWPGDAFLYSRKFLDQLKIYEKIKENEMDGSFDKFDEESHDE